MTQLKILLQSKILYIILFIVIVIFIFFKTFIISYESLYTGEETSITGTVTDYSVEESKISLTIEGEETIIAYYYYEEDFDYSNMYGKEVLLTGEIYEAENNTVPNTFNYKEYLYYNKIYYLFSVDEITYLGQHFNLKNSIVNKVEGLVSGNYLLMFILGDKSGISDEIYSVYQENGLAHLLAISGLHINLFIMLLEKILRNLKSKVKNKIVLGFLFFYAYLTSFSVSVLRCVLFYIISSINKKLDINIGSIKILFLTAFLLLLYNPFYIYSAGFQYSFIITFFLLIIKVKPKNYFLTLLIISFTSVLASLPITANMNFEINISSVLFNLFFVPFVSFIVFPLSLLTFIFPFLDKILYFFIVILENSNIFCNSYLSYIINIPKLSIIAIVFYYIFLYLFVRFKKKFIIFIVIILIINKLSYKMDSSYYVYYMDIGQGDSNILISPHQKEVVMIDTGGSYYYTVSDNVILFLKSIGITSIDLLVISHGDSDHALDTENIYNNLEIKNIMFNFNEINELEESIKLLNIPEVTEVNLKYFNASNLNSNLDNENDASIVLFFYMYNYTFLFTGDIGTDPLTDLVNTYDVSCDFYKVAHHGSANNTSDYIIKTINPSYAFISAGENNVYNHPSEDVLEILDENNVDTYQTLIDGTVCVKISKNEYHISTYPA